MTRLTENQGKRLCELVHLLRRSINGPAWDLPGIEVAVRTAAKDSDAAEVCIAAIRASQNPRATTPGLIPLAGEHWQSTQRGERAAPSMCEDHPNERLGRCQQCDAQASPPPTGWRDHLPKATARPDRSNPIEAARLTPEQRAAATAALPNEGDQP